MTRPGMQQLRQIQKDDDSKIEYAREDFIQQEFKAIRSSARQACKLGGAKGKVDRDTISETEKAIIRKEVRKKRLPEVKSVKDVELVIDLAASFRHAQLQAGRTEIFLYGQFCPKGKYYGLLIFECVSSAK